MFEGDSVTSEWSFSRRLFRPWALLFIGLAISVALWGFGYKLSRYNPHPNAASRSSLAKLWDKHQDISQLASASEAAAQPPQIHPGLRAVLDLLCQTPSPEKYAFSPPDEFKRIPVLFGSVVPLRSPPFQALAA